MGVVMGVVVVLVVIFLVFFVAKTIVTFRLKRSKAQMKTAKMKGPGRRQETLLQCVLRVSRGLAGARKTAKKGPRRGWPSATVVFKALLAEARRSKFKSRHWQVSERTVRRCLVRLREQFECPSELGRVRETMEAVSVGAGSLYFYDRF